jgi:hypothetical protein
MKGNLYQHIKIRYAYDFSLCFPHELLMSFWRHYHTCHKVVQTSYDIQSWYNKNVTRLTTQGCNNIVISWLYRTCWNNLATSLIIYQQGYYKLLTACSILVDNLGQAVRTQLVGRLATRCEISCDMRDACV